MSEVDINKRVRQFLDSALSSFAVEDYNRAIKKLKEAEGIDRENPEILYNIGVSFCKTGEYGDAIVYFKKLLDLPFTFIDIITVNKLLAYSLILSGKLDEAVGYMKKVLKLSPGDLVILSMLGYCYEKLDKIPDSISIYRKILEIDNRNYNAYNSLAYILARVGKNLDEALKLVRVALDSNPENPAYIDTIGFIYMKKGNNDLAKKYLKKAFSILPDSTEIKGHIEQLLEIGKK